MSSNLATLLFKDYRQQILELLLLQPDQQYNVREIARLTGIMAGTLHNELAILADTGVLVREVVDNHAQYRANTDCLIYEELCRILEKFTDFEKPESKTGKIMMSALVEKYREQILSLAKLNGLSNVRVFGSMAHIEAEPDSHLDLLVEIDKGQAGLGLDGFLADVTGLIHCKVDVVTEKSLHPMIRDKVLHDARLL